MNLRQLRARLDEIEAEAGTDAISIGVAENGQMLGIERIDSAAYRDSGEVSHVAWIVTREY